ncbi:hypothetical protein JOH51_001868 [Rhizobium leguminosarum]|nr:hypothetical protein [Rhizobium leguminosarum]
MRFRRLISRFTPLCPAGHLPHKGGDRQEDSKSVLTDSMLDQGPFVVWGSRFRISISPPVAEMPGRAEGGGYAFDPKWGQSL